MKPDWKDAPDWAEYLAMDGNGDWFWHEFKPQIQEREWFNRGRWQACTVWNMKPVIENKPH